MPRGRPPFEVPDDEVRWKRYRSPSRQRLSDQYHHARGDTDLVEGGEVYVPRDVPELREGEERE